jgi:hypothetical protein
MTPSRRKRRRAASIGLLPGDHDGILDVLANLVGVLALVGALTAILAANSAVKIKTPLARDTTKEFLILQVGKAGVWDLQSAKERMLALEQERISGWKDCLSYSIYEMIHCVNRMESWSATEQVGQVSVNITSEGASIARLAVPTEKGEDIDKDGSWLRQKMKSASKQGKAIFIILEKEGFANFRTVRSIAAEHNLQLGWEPWNTGDPIFFGSGGRTMNVQ